MAQSMNCRFVYAIVPEGDIEESSTLEKARAEVKAASVHMALEEQSLSKNKLEEQVQSLAREMVDKASSDLWNDE